MVLWCKRLDCIGADTLSYMQGAQKPGSTTTATMTYIVPKASTTHQTVTGLSVSRSLPQKTSGVVLATILTGLNSQINGNSRTVTTGVGDPSKLNTVLVGHSVSYCLAFPSAQGLATKVMSSTANSQLTSHSVDVSMVVRKTTQFIPKEAEHFSENKIDIRDDTKLESKEASRIKKSPPVLEYFNADLMLKEYNLRQSEGASTSFERLKENKKIKNHRSSCEISASSKRERSLESQLPHVCKKVKLDVIKGSQEDEHASKNSTTCSPVDSQLPRLSQNLIKHDARSRSKQSLRRKASVQQRKPRSHTRPQLYRTAAVVSEDHTCEDLLCAFCYQRGGAKNLGFLYGPYKFSSTFINGHEIDNNKTSTRDHQEELWVHEDCAVWAPGVCLVGDQLIGLQQAVVDGDNMVLHVATLSK